MGLLRYSYEDGRVIGTSNTYLNNQNQDVIPAYSTNKPLPEKKLNDDEFWSYRDENSNVPSQHYRGKWVVKHKLIAVTAYSKQTRETKEFDDKSLVTIDYTLIKPTTQFDDWIDGEWVTNQDEKYQHDYNQVDTTRRAMYAAQVDPLLAEAAVKKAMGLEKESADFIQQALALRAKIQKENQFPELVRHG